MYTFVKLKNTWQDMNLEYPWMFKATTMQDIIDHNNIYMHSLINAGVEDAFKNFDTDRSKNNRYRHASTEWRKVVDQLYEVSGKIKALLKFGCIYIGQKGNYCVAYNDMIEEVIKEKEELSYPEKGYTEKDIKVSRWPEGKHFYARIAGIDVKELDGTIKWSTYERAYEESIKFLERLR